MKKITLEYDSYCLCKNKFGFSPDNTEKPIKNPRAWEVITVENSVKYMPGQCLTKNEVKKLCTDKTYTVQIGPRGQFRKKKK